MTDDDPNDRVTVKEIARLEQRFIRLSEDFNNLRNEINELEDKVERRT